jgi:hypothetical protein
MNSEEDDTLDARGWPEGEDALGVAKKAMITYYMSKEGPLWVSHRS